MDTIKQRVANLAADSAKDVPEGTTDRGRLIEIQLKAMELLILRGITELDNRIRDHFHKQDSSNQLLADATNRLTDTIETSFKEVLDSAVSKQHVPSDMVKMLVRTLGGVVFFLTFTLVFVLTGIQLRWFPDFHGIPQQIQQNREYLNQLKAVIEHETGKNMPEPPPTEVPR